MTSNGLLLKYESFCNNFRLLLKKKYFYLGLVVFYLIILLSPNKLIYFSAFFISTFIFYLHTRNVRSSLLFALILSVFSDVNIASSWFIMQPKELNLDSGYWISPLTFLILALLPFSIIVKKFTVKLPDVSIILFLLWLALGFILNPHINVFYGLILLTELILAYFILRLNLKRVDFPDIVILFISMLIFQLVIGLPQLVLKRPLGLTAEVETGVSPYGTLAAEGENLYRLSGTFWHPNFFASYLIAFLPFVFFAKTKYPLFDNLFRILISVVIIFTQSRLALFLMIGFYLIYAYEKRVYLTSKLLNKLRTNKRLLTVSAVSVITAFIIVMPYVYLRLNTVPEAFDDPGSMTTRFKLAQEAFSLITQYPISGVGLNRSLEFYGVNPVTDIFQNMRPSSFYKIHNLFLEIAAETGIIGLMFFLLFVSLVIKKYLNDRNKIESLWIKNFRKACFYGLILWLIFSSFHPFLGTSQMRYFVLLSALLMV